VFPTDGDGSLVLSAESSLDYILVLHNLVDRPDLATPEVLDLLEQAANDGGIWGISDALHDPRLALEGGGAAFAEMQEIVLDQERAPRDAGMLPLPWPDCPATRSVE
jgi:hypothetical protein